MSEATARFTLPFILPGQAQKELSHNEALVRIDAISHAASEGPPATDPPPAPDEGQCWVVADPATGAWSGHGKSLAVWTGGGWRFLDPQPGMLVWNKELGVWMHFDGAAWINGGLPATAFYVAGQQVVGQRQPPVPSPSGGTIIDQEARAAIGEITAALMSHGLIG
ncbi:MAG TPA: DUF2793 domain-containing protein [Allosphingosinicella sp.]|uniref:DUF2793 domain-containing protein n=1 Tax=Allosphingosinicella sp. TaxID=2823234 RepID=UPI002ED9B9E8